MIMTVLKAFLVLAAAFTLGSIPFSFLVTRAVRGIDLRQSGSGNLGAANTARAAGILPALLVFVADSGKGALAMVLATRLFGHGPLALAALAATILGHNFSPFVGFSGGKGLAAAAGGLLIFSPGLLLATGTLGLTVLIASADFYLAAMAMAAGLPGLTALFAPGPWQVLLATAVAAIVLIRHRVNLAGLWSADSRRAGMRDDVFALLVSLAALTITVALLNGMPMLIVAGRWAAAGLTLLAAWALLSRFGRKCTSFLAGSAVPICFALLIAPYCDQWYSTAGLVLPPLMTQIGDGSWPIGQASVAAVGAYHLFWVVGLSVAALISRALREQEH